MAAKAVREHDGKLIIYSGIQDRSLLVDNAQNLLKQIKIRSEVDLTIELDKLDSIDWLKSSNLVCKPDMLMKRRGKSGLLLLNKSLEEVKQWIREVYSRKTKVGKVEGTVDTFIIEPFVKHEQHEEYYICIQTLRNADEILFTVEGGIDVGNVEEKASKISVELTGNNSLSGEQLDSLFNKVDDNEKRQLLDRFVKELYAVFCSMHFTYLEINPLVISRDLNNQYKAYCLDLAAKIDQTAEFEAGSDWVKAMYPDVSNKDYNHEMNLEFPAPFGSKLTPEELYIQDLDSKTGASLKLTILNNRGKIWTLVAGGGASVVYSDAIAALGKDYLKELANYGEYSGAPSTSQTYEYAKTILDLMTRKYDDSLQNNNQLIEGKVLFIGGGIANFTNVASTFKGIIKALREYQHDIINNKIRIFIRRAGPNYQEGLRAIKQVGEELKIDMQVFGPETHITAIVPLALAPNSSNINVNDFDKSQNLHNYDVDIDSVVSSASLDTSYNGDVSSLFDRSTKAIVYGMQTKAVQGMLDFDFICKRSFPSVVAIVYPFGGNHLQKFYWGTREIMLPVFSGFEDAIEKFADVTVCINFASCRSVYSTTMEMLKYNHRLRSIAIIAEGVPERKTRTLIQHALNKNVKIIGPATVGGIKPGCFKIGNTGGMMDNIVSSKLYRPGSVAYVSKSGGMSNELNHIISLTTDGVYEGVAIGGDKYPVTTFMDHLIRFQEDPNCSILVLLGEVGGVEEYLVCKALKEKAITKPVVAWCIGTCASMFDNTEIQFGHAGSMANSESETALEKNKALREAGALVPNTFEDMPLLLSKLYKKMVDEGKLVPKREVEAPKIPIDYSWAVELGLVRKPASFMSTISDERGEELMYAGMKISDVFKENIGIGGVLSLLWFKRRLPGYFCEFIEMVLMLTADHGPAVSGAHNTIVTARAGRDLVSSLATGILTIGQRFGGALDGAAQMFSEAYDKNLSPKEFVDSMRKQNKLIMGIGHKIKSRNNPDHRVTLVKEFAQKNFPSTPLLDYALQVEQITTSKKENLILNVDGAIGVLFVDLLRDSGAFSSEEAEEYIKIGTLNGLFVLGRTIGFIGHYLDQKRLKQGLYRHPWDDISYMDPSQASSFGETNGSTSVAASERTFVGLEEAKKATKNKF